LKLKNVASHDIILIGV